jgi:PAS domain S-box-containing protein
MDEDCGGANENKGHPLQDFEQQGHLQDPASTPIANSQEGELEQTQQSVAQEVLQRRRAEQALREQNQVLQALHRASQALNSSLDLPQVLGTVLEEVRTLMGIVAGSIWLLDPATGELVCHQASGPSSEVVRGWRLAPGTGIAGHTVRQGKPVLVSDLRSDPRHFPGVDEKTGLDLRSILSIPLKTLQRDRAPDGQKDVIGVLQVVDSEVGRFDASHLTLLEFLAASAAVAIENAQLYAQVQQELAHRERLEEAYQTVVDHSLQALTILQDNRIVFGNTALSKLTGYTLQEIYALTPHRLRAMIHPQDQSRIWSALQARWAGGEGGIRHEFRFITKAGDVHWVEALANRIQYQGVPAVQIAYVDITERKQAEEALQQSHDLLEMRVTARTTELELANQQLCQEIEERKRAEVQLRFQGQLLEHVRESVIATDLEGRITYWNRFAQELYGWPASEALGRNIIDITPAEDVQAQAAEIMDQLRRGEQWSGEFMVRRRDGTTFPAIVVDSPVYNADDELIGIIGVSLDITERKAMEEALRESEKRYRTLFDSASDAIFIYDLATRLFLEVNRIACRHLGYSREELLQMKVPEIDTRSHAMMVEERLLRLQEKGNLFFEVEHLRKDGSAVPVEVHARLIEYEGQSAVLSIARDISERKQVEAELQQYRAHLEELVEGRTTELVAANRRLEQQILERARTEQALRESEQKFRSIIQQSQDGIALMDEEGIMVEWNRGQEQIMGLAQREVLGRPMWDVQFQVAPQEEARQPEARERLREMLIHFTQTGEMPGMNRLVERPIQRPDGERRIIQVLAFPIPTEKGYMAGSITRDVTEQKRIETHVRQQAARAAALARVAAALNAPLDLVAALDVVCQQTARALDVPATGIVLYDPEDDVLQLEAVHGMPREILDRAPSVSRVCYEKQQKHLGASIVIPDVRQVQDVAIAEAYASHNVRTVVALPMTREGEFIGALNVYTLDEPRDFSLDELDLLRGIANQAALAIVQARLFDQVSVGRERLQALSHRLVEAQEVERRRIARELHDEVGQALTVIKINLQAAQRLKDPAAWAEHLEESIRTVQQTLQQVRNLSLDLRPSLLDDLGLVPAVRWYIDRQAQQAGLEAEFVTDLADERFSSDLEIVCFRIVQEALTNVVRHAQAERIKVGLEQHDSCLHLRIQDDGVGFDVQEALHQAAGGTSLGLLSMQERVALLGGEMRIDSAPGRGTEIEVQLPITLVTLAGSVNSG